MAVHLPHHTRSSRGMQLLAAYLAAENSEQDLRDKTEERGRVAADRGFFFKCEFVRERRESGAAARRGSC